MSALQTLRRAGFTVSLAGSDRLIVSPINRIDDELRSFIRDNRDEILESLPAYVSHSANLLAPVTPTATVFHAGGVGTELMAIMPKTAKLWASLFPGGCGCSDYAAKMDRWGIEGCESRHAEIVAHLVSKAPFGIRSLPSTKTTATELLDQAIANENYRLNPPPIEDNGDWFVIVTTAPRAECTLQKTVASLRHAGWEPTVFAEPGSTKTNAATIQNETQLGVWHNWQASARYAIEHSNAKMILTVQDDCIFHDESRQFIESIAWPANCGFVSLYTSKAYSTDRGGDQRPNGVNHIRTQSLWGSCAIAWPRSVIEQILDSPIANTWQGADPPRQRNETLKQWERRRVKWFEDRRADPTKIAQSDTVLGEVMNSLGLRMHVVLPSLASHISQHSTIGNGGNDGNRNCDRCADHAVPISEQIPAPDAAYTVGDVTIATTHFNFAKCQRTERTYQEWLPKLPAAMADRVTCYECVLYDDEAEIPDSIQVRGRERNLLWQKESLLQIALERCETRLFCWIDHDTYAGPEHHDWLEKSIAKLSTDVHAVQMFSEILYHSPDGSAESKRSIQADGHSPGGAWIADADWLRSVGGFPTLAIMGNGDRLLYSRMKHHADYLGVTAHHIWHGDLKGRRYQERHKSLADLGFDPDTHVGVDDNGLACWTAGTPEMQESVRDYFAPYSTRATQPFRQPSIT